IGRGVRNAGIGAVPTVRASIMIARLVAMNGMQPTVSDAVFRQTCLDVLRSGGTDEGDGDLEQVLMRLMQEQL
ncbi:MAG: hypothetical protein KAX19_01445, partial [Candidatus Brocadiae bacterium]|nr:hypothetical protein [Candidatus Brocadiia bacterium]